MYKVWLVRYDSLWLKTTTKGIQHLKQTNNSGYSELEK